MENKLLYYCLFLLGLLSCSPSHQTQVSGVTLIETPDTLSFMIKPSVSVYNHSLQLFTDTDGKEYITLFDKGSTEIQFYDLHVPDLLKSIKFEKEGPNGIGNSYLFYMKDWDTLYIPARDLPMIYVMNSEGQIERTLDFTNNSEITVFNSYFYHSIFVSQNKLYSYIAPRRTSGDILLESPSEIAIDLETGNYMLSPNLLNQEVNQAISGQQFIPNSLALTSRCFDGENLVYSYSYNDSLVVMSPDFSSVTSKIAKSRYIKTLDIPQKYSGDFDENWRQYCSDAFYGHIVYDPYRKLYYRFAYPQTELDSKKENWYDLSQSGRNEFSIIVLDEDLNVIGETMFPRDRFRSNLYFVCKDGFYISCNHYKNPGYTDDKLQFVKFELKEK